MDLRRRLQNHRARWNIEVDEYAQFDQLRNRIIERVDQLVGNSFAKDVDIDRRLVYLLGEKLQIPESSNFVSAINNLGQQRAFGSTYLYKKLNAARGLERLTTVLQNMFLVLEEREYPHIKELAEEVREATKFTPAVSFNVSRRGESVVIFPVGAKPLDEGTVNDVSDWLSNYPKVAKSFEQALEIYMKGERGNYRNLFDNLRFALEQLLKCILGNKKSLENQEQPLLKWIKVHGIHQQVANMYKQLLFGPYRIYQNQAVKHGEEYSEKEAEFMIYLTGTFMRLLLQLDENKSN